MKTLLNILLVLTVAVAPAFADKNVKAGPRKGLLLGTTPSTEFFVEKNRTVTIAFYDAALKAQAPSAQAVTGTAEAPGGKAKIEFEKKGNLLVSKTPLPEGEGYQIVLQVKENADAKAKNFRIKLLTHTCNGCSHPEYACTCDE